MVDEKVRDIIACYVNAALRAPHASLAIAEEIMAGLKTNGYEIISREDLSKAIDKAAEDIARFTLVMDKVMPRTTKQ